MKVNAMQLMPTYESAMATATSKPIPKPPGPDFGSKEPPIKPPIKDSIKNPVPGSDKVPPIFDIFSDKSTLLNMAHDAAKAYRNADAVFEQKIILDQFKDQLNSFSAIRKSNPPQPIYDYSNAELKSLAQELQPLAYPKCHCENAESYREVLFTVNQALEDRKPNPILKWVGQTLDKLGA